MKLREASMQYQRSLMIVFLRSTLEVLGKDCGVRVEHALNKGMLCRFDKKILITEFLLREIEKNMRSIISSDIPFTKEILSPDEAKEIYAELGLTNKIRQMKYYDNEYPTLYGCGWFLKSCHGPVLPSTGSLIDFDLQIFEGGIILRYPDIYRGNMIAPYVPDYKIGEVFEESHLWAKKLGISYAADLNEKIETNQGTNVIHVCEALQEKKIIEIAEKITASKKKIVLIAGPSSSGKTSFAQRLSIQLQVNGLNTLAFSTDDFYINRSETPLDSDGKPDFESLDAIDIPLFNSCVEGLLSGEKVDMPIFDFTSGTKVFGQNYMMGNSATRIIIEGIHGLNPKLVSGFSPKETYKIYVSALTQLNMDEYSRISTSELRLIRRLIRDSWSRESDPSHTLRFWHKVREGEEKNIFPYQEESDSIFNSALVYELSVLKSFAEPLLKKIPKEDVTYEQAQNLLHFLSGFLPIQEVDQIPCNSIIKEFIGGSCFFT